MLGRSYSKQKERRNDHRGKTVTPRQTVGGGIDSWGQNTEDQETLTEEEMTKYACCDRSLQVLPGSHLGLKPSTDCQARP